MALQNLFGDLALNQTAVDTNTLLQQLSDLTYTLNMLIQRISQTQAPVLATNGIPLVTLSSSGSNATTAPFYTATNGTYDPRFGIISNMMPMQDASMTAAATAIYSNIKVS